MQESKSNSLEEVQMYSENEIKKQIASIESSSDRPVRKARKLLKLSRTLKRQLHHFKRQEHEDIYALSRDKFEHRIRRLIEDIRLGALRCLEKTHQKKIGYKTTVTYGGSAFRMIK